MPPSIPPTLTLSKGGGAVAARKGRGLLASKAFEPGDLIATFEDPLVAIPDSVSLSTTCSWCLSVAPPSPSPSPSSSSSSSSSSSFSKKATPSVRFCKACEQAAYCSTACQKADWTRGTHKVQCKAFRRVRAEAGLDATLPTPVRALMHVLLSGPAGSEVDAALAELEGHVGEVVRHREQFRDMQLQALAALHYMGGDDEDEGSVAEAVEIACKMQVNTFNRLDVDIGQTGLFLHPALAMINHSCIPNAFVQFSGRKAILRAYQAIKKGEEVEISYIENTLHRSHRQEALKSRYHFDCICPRCSEDLDVYQVCQRYPHLELNFFSLTPNFQVLREHPAQESLNSNITYRRDVEKIYPSCSTPLPNLAAPQKREELRRRWNLCRNIRKAKAFAVEPLNQVLVEASVYLGEQGDFAAPLAICCFLAIHVDPYRCPMPFNPQRVKGLLIVARILTNTASGNYSPSMGSTNNAVRTKLSEILDKADQMTMCHVVLALVVRWGTAAHSDEWQVYSEARDLLKNLKSLRGREKEYAMVETFAQNPDGPDASIFFENVVFRPIRELSEIALDIMALEFGS